MEHVEYWGRTRDVQASQRKGIFSAVHVLPRKTEGEHPRPGAEPGVA